MILYNLIESTIKNSIVEIYEKIEKDKRDKLSHGEQTFYSIGKDFTVKELDGFKEEVICYLKDVIKNIETFIDLKKYKLREA